MGGPTFKPNGDWNKPDKQPYIKVMMLKPAGESDGCVDSEEQMSKSKDTNAGKRSPKVCIIPTSKNQYECARFDTMCGIEGTRGYNSLGKSGVLSSSSLDDDFKTNLATCPPEAGVWDPIQIERIANNYLKTN